MSENQSKKHSAVTREARSVAQLVVESRLANAFEHSVSRYPIHRILRYAARMDLEALFDAIALEPQWHAERVNSEVMLLDGDGVFLAAYGSRKLDYCSCCFYVWAADIARAEGAKTRVLA